MDDYDYLFKCIIVGDGGAGKTAVVVRFSQGFFKEIYKLTIGVEFAVKNLLINKNTVKLQIWDTGGQDRFKYVRPLYYKGAMGCIVLFDLTNRDSFDHIPRWLDEVNKEAGEIPLLLVGNKSDLVDQRVITFEEAKEIADQLNMEYIESSAKTGDGIGDVFKALSFLMMGEKIPIEFLPKSTDDKNQSKDSISKREILLSQKSNVKVFPKEKQKVKSNRPPPLGIDGKNNKPQRPPPLNMKKGGHSQSYKHQNAMSNSKKILQSSDTNPFLNIKKSRPDSQKSFPKPPQNNKKAQVSVDKRNVDPGLFTMLKSSSNNQEDLIKNSQSSSLFEDDEKKEVEKQGRVCSNCGTNVNPNFKFCNKCGKRMK